MGQLKLVKKLRKTYPCDGNGTKPLTKFFLRLTGLLAPMEFQLIDLTLPTLFSQYLKKTHSERKKAQQLLYWITTKWSWDTLKTEIFFFGVTDFFQKTIRGVFWSSIPGNNGNFMAKQNFQGTNAKASVICFYFRKISGKYLDYCCELGFRGFNPSGTGHEEVDYLASWPSKTLYAPNLELAGKFQKDNTPQTLKNFQFTIFFQGDHYSDRMIMEWKRWENATDKMDRCDRIRINARRQDNKWDSKRVDSNG